MDQYDLPWSAEELAVRMGCAVIFTKVIIAIGLGTLIAGLIWLLWRFGI